MSVLTAGLPTRSIPSRLVVTPAVVAHRGASGYHPEHTLGAYRAAVRMGADAVELDVVPTADGVLVVRHESELSATTDVADHPGLADRRTTRRVGGRRVTGWFTDDLTLAEVRTLRCRERHPALRPGNTLHDGREGVATLGEVLAAVGTESVRRERAVGVMIELKSPARFAARGLPLEEPLLAELRCRGLDHARSGVTVMSFDRGILRRLASRTTVPLVQLLDVGDRLDAVALDAIERYADGVGVHQALVRPRTPDGRLDAPTRLVREAHRRWLDVHVWTLRAENRYLPVEHRLGDDPAVLGDLPGLAADLLDAGVDGLITDHPDLALRAVAAAV